MDKTRSSKHNKGSWNYVVPQDQRLPSLVKSLRRLGVSLDVVAIQEAQQTAEQHNGQELARQLGFEASFWAEHNTSRRKGENIGMFGNLVHEVETYELPHDKKMMLTKVGDVAIANIHNRNEVIGPMRTDQMREVVRITEPYERVVVGGDGNDVYWGRSHRVLRAAGLEPVNYPGGELHPKTHPTERYRLIMQGVDQEYVDDNGMQAHRGVLPMPKRLLSAGLPLDIVYARGLEAVSGGVFEGDSDHRGRWVKLRTVS